MSPTYHRHPGNIFVGRVMVVAACLLVLCINALIFKQADVPPHPPLPVLKGVAVISFLWMIVGAWGMCTHKNWGRVLVLTILYAGSFGFFVTALITLATADPALAPGLKPFFLAMVVYLITSLILTHSKHVRRLTSRAFE